MNEGMIGCIPECHASQEGGEGSALPRSWVSFLRKALLLQWSANYSSMKPSLIPTPAPKEEEHSTGKGRNASNEHMHNFSKHAVHVAPPKCLQATTQADSPGQPAPREESREKKQKL
ncbi:uncharacterized protein LOC129016890 [Pongo pygmaeus]|uniref:uncharacterized protein LOC129016890 n=1 Tax=Pongo pygmaeus TaxID=9600 RepID=UPI0023E279F7|nr:uncharacterized protein LOC129016890 [Pongo pygmaeus]